MCCATYREENEWWAVGEGEDGNVGVHGDVTGGRGGSGRLDRCWNFNWDEDECLAMLYD